MKQVIEAILAPSHASSFESLLDEPFACTLHHPTAEGKVKLLEPGAIDVLPVLFQIVMEVGESTTLLFGKILYLQYFLDVFEQIIGLSMTKLVTYFTKRFLCCIRGVLNTGRDCFPHILCSMIDENPYSVPGKTLLIDGPQTRTSIALIHATVFAVSSP